MGIEPVGPVFGENSFNRETRSTRTGDVVVLTPPPQPPVSLTRSQSSGTGSSASCEYCCPLCPTGALYWENSFYRAPRGKLAQETRAGCPQQRDATGKPDKDQKRDRVGKPGLQDMWLNVVLTPG